MGTPTQAGTRTGGVVVGVVVVDVVGAVVVAGAVVVLGVVVVLTIVVDVAARAVEVVTGWRR
jgi:hypothetical protein